MWSRHLSPQAVLGGGLLVALIATVGSLNFSLGMDLFPCRLCWYQRILMYPLVVILGVAYYERRVTVYRVTLPLSVLGGSIALYQSALQQGVIGSATCGAFSCATIQYQLFGVLTIPNLSFIAFSLLTAMGYWLARAPSLHELVDDAR